MVSERRSAVFGLSVVASISLAGPLDPPAGPVAPTAKPLAEVEPRVAISATNTPGDANSLFKITQPGSYYLTGNITGVVGKHGIEIAASGVTVDLNGFDMVGVPGMGGFDGVTLSVPDLTNVTVRNGSVRNWGDRGVDLLFLSDSAVVIDIVSSGNTGGGIAVDDGGIISRCIAFKNAGQGIVSGNSTVISECISRENTGNGINAGSGSTVSACSVAINTANGIVVNSDSRVLGNDCSTNGNGGDGAGVLVTGSDNRIEDNHCTDNDRGVDVNTAGNFIARNTCSGNTLNWDVVAGNVIFVVNATTAAAVTGDSGGTSPGSTNPNANFTY